MREEVMRGVLGLRRDRLAAAELDCSFAGALLGTLAGGGHARVHQQRGGNGEVVDVPAIDLAAPVLHRCGEWRGFDVDGPAGDAHAVVDAVHLGLAGRVIRAAAQSRWMHERQVREIQQVVANEQVVHVIVNVAIVAAPVGMVEPLRVGDQRGVGLGRVAHPHPHPAVALHHRESTDLGLNRNAFLCRGFDALAAVIELQAVVHAAHTVAFATAHRQWCTAVAAAVFHRDDLAVLLAVHENGHTDDGAGEHAFLGDFMVPSRYIPSVFDEHGFVSWLSSTESF